MPQTAAFFSRFRFVVLARGGGRTIAGSIGSYAGCGCFGRHYGFGSTDESLSAPANAAMPERTRGAPPTERARAACKGPEFRQRPPPKRGVGGAAPLGLIPHARRG